MKKTADTKFTFDNDLTPSPMECPVCIEEGMTDSDVERHEISEGNGRLYLSHRCYPYGHEWREVWVFESYTISKGEEE
jgi:hypothetical protein